MNSERFKLTNPSQKILSLERQIGHLEICFSSLCGSRLNLIHANNNMSIKLSDPVEALPLIITPIIYSYFSYAVCFTSGDEFINLDAKYIFLKSNEKKTHQDVIDARNKVIAHLDMTSKFPKNKYEIYYIKDCKQEKINDIDVVTRYGVNNFLIPHADFLNLINKALSYVEEEIKKKKRKLIEEINNFKEASFLQDQY